MMQLAAGHTTAQEQALPRGQLVEKVTCTANPAQTYALYLPSRYSPDRAWPILYAFDAGARGALPVERFREAAERYGYIVAGSNNSRNGPLAIADEALRAIVADAHARFRLDAKRIYVAGFSGGARVAVLAGVAIKAAGVIGAAAGFDASVQPSPSLPFAYFGTVGTDDFNYVELVQLDEALARSGVRHHLEVFEGGHDWPPAPLCTRAIEWMELQAMRTSIRPTDAALIDGLFASAVAEAAAHEQAGRLPSAFDRYSAVVTDFAAWRDVAPYEQKARQLAGSKEVRSTLAERRKSIELQRAAETSITRLIAQALDGDDRALARQEATAAIAELRRQSNEPQDSASRMAARRVLATAWSGLNAAASEDFERGNLVRAADRLDLMALIRPDNYRVDYQMARAFARSGKTKPAIEALQRAIKKGFKDAAALESEADFAKLLTQRDFQTLLSRLKTR
jgi:predicted esterase